MMSILELKNVSRRWVGRKKTVDAVQHVSLNVDAGEFHVIRGASGAGKSTLILLAAGVSPYALLTGLDPRLPRVMVAGHDAHVVTQSPVADASRLSLGQP